MRLGLLPLAALLIAAAPPPPSPEEKAQLNESYKQIQQAFAQAIACKRDTVGMLLPLSASMWQIEDTVKLRYDAASAKALSDLPDPATAPCGGEEDGKQRIAADQYAFEYLTRLATVQQANATAGWTQNISDLSELPPLLEAFRVQLGNILVQVYGQQPVAQMIQQIGGETTNDLAFACEGRKTRGTASPRACPAVPAELASIAPIGTARLVNLEEMAKRFKQQGENPFGPAWHYASEADDAAWFTRSLETCKGFIVVVYLKDPGAVISGQQVTLPERTYEDGRVVRPVTLTMPASYGEQVLEPAKKSGSVYAEEYDRCLGQ